MTLSFATPELPVADVKAAQADYRERLGFDVNWYNADGKIGTVSQGDCAIFLRQSDAPITPVTLWIFAKDVDAAFAEMRAKGAQIVAQLAETPWGLRQFTVRDLNGHNLQVFHDV